MYLHFYCCISCSQTGIHKQSVSYKTDILHGGFPYADACKWEKKFIRRMTQSKSYLDWVMIPFLTKAPYTHHMLYPIYS